MDYDFALIQLNDNATTSIIELNVIELLAGQELRVAGWGLLKEDGDMSNKLQKVTLPLVSNSTCNKAYPGMITDRMLCAGYNKGGKDLC